MRTGPNPKIVWNKYSENTFIVYAQIRKKKKKEKPVSLPSLDSFVCICSLYPWIFRVTWCSLCLQAFFPPILLTSPLCNSFAPSHFFFSPTGMLPGGNERLASNTIAMVSLNEFTLNGDRLGEEVIMYDVPLHQSDIPSTPLFLK